MRSRADKLKARGAETFALLAASAVVAGLLAAGVAARRVAAPWPDEVSAWLPASGLLTLGLLTAFLLYVRARRGPGGGFLPSAGETSDARWKLAAADALATAEPQALILWEKDKPLKLLVHSLSLPGVPAALGDILQFGQWLEPQSARGLRAALEALFGDGQPFGMILKTQGGVHLDADGRTAGGRAVIRLRDMAAHRRDYVEVIERNGKLARDVRASRALLQALPHPVWLKDGEGRVNWVNDAYVRAVEAANENEVVERQIELLDVRQRQAVSRAMGRGQPYRRRVVLTANGGRRAHDVVALPLDGGIAATALEVAEPAADESRGDAGQPLAGADHTLDRVETAVAVFNRDQKLTVFNDAFVKLWQLDAAWLASEPMAGAVFDRLRDLARLPESANYRDWKTQALSPYKTGAELRDWWHLPDDRVLRVVAEPRPDGGVTYLYADETERLKLQSSFNALITVQRETLNSLKEGVAVFATDGRLTLHNRAFATLWGLDPASLDARPHIDEVTKACQSELGASDEWDAIAKAVTAFSEQRESAAGQMALPKGLVVDYAATPLPDGAMLLTFADVTAAKAAERALIERNEELVMEDRLKNQFIKHVKRELGSPLDNIIGFSELLASPRTGLLNVKQREYLKDIASSSKTLLSTIENILDVASMDAGALKLTPAYVDVHAVIDAAIDAVRDRAARARLTLDIGVAEDVVSFYADETRVRQVLYNLLANAIGFSTPGKVVRLTCRREDGDMIFSVMDEGVGIPKDQQARVFDKFETRSHGQNHRGAGLGLSIVKSIVELHGGEMTLTSEPGRGTRVTVRFPDRPSPEVSEKPEKQKKKLAVKT